MLNDLNYRTLDLFAGVGGISLGFEQAGFKTVYANDSDLKCKETYDLNSSKVKLDVQDMWKINISELPEFDVLLAGFPCQAFSVAGYRQGFSDERGNVFFRISDILEKVRPTALFLENKIVDIDEIINSFSDLHVEDIIPASVENFEFSTSVIMDRIL